MSSRGKKLFLNTGSSLIFQVTTIICGFILPRLILKAFGSEVNGLVNSITQFLGIISFLELGVGSVIQSSLYKPLADKDENQISKVVVSGQKFFSKLTLILLVYVIILMGIYPFIANQKFGFVYTATMIAVISISSFAQYYFGIVNRLLLTADQKGYISYNAQTITLILNTVACFILIKIGASIHIVKLTTSLIYIVRPIVLAIYVKRHYKLNWKIQYEGEPIKQKWNEVAQHVSAVILDGTDNIVLTIFSGLKAVSVYSVYNLVVSGVKQLLLSMTNGIQSLIGELWAKKELDNLYSFFGWVEWSIHTGTTFIFGVTSILIIPFVQVYTSGVSDVNYIIAAIINIVISIVAVKTWGLVGVAIGTAIAMFYQTIWMAFYDPKNLIKWPFTKFLKQIAVDFITVFFLHIIANPEIGGKISVINRIFVLSIVSYVSWIVLAIKIVMLIFLLVVSINFIFYKVYVIKVKKGVSEMIRKMMGGIGSDSPIAEIIKKEQVYRYAC